MTRNNADFRRTEGHGDSLDFYKHIENGSLRIAIAPPGNAYFEHLGDRIAVFPSPDHFSWVTPENPGTENWKEGKPRHYEIARAVFDKEQKKPEFQEKLGQIKRSCPICSEMMKDDDGTK